MTGIRGAARIAAPGKVVVQGADGTQELSATRILIATGSEATPLKDIPFDGERVVSSTEALSLGTVPRRPPSRTSTIE